MLASAVLILTCWPAAQLGSPTAAPPTIVTRPDDGEVLPRGGFFVATINNDVDNAYRITRLRYGTSDADIEQIEVFASCVTFGDTCIFRTRFPFEAPATDGVILEVQANSERVADFSAWVNVGESDRYGPRGINSMRIEVTERPGSALAPGGGTTLVVTAPELEDEETSIALLEFFETTDGDSALLAHAVPAASWNADDIALYVDLDLPQSDLRCFQLVATDLGGNASASTERCIYLIVAEEPGRACSQRGAAPSLFGLLALLGLLSRRR